MGKTVILVVLGAMIVIGGIFVALNQKGAASAEATSEQAYLSLARNVANTYANVMLSTVLEQLTTGVGMSILPTIDEKDVLGIDDSIVSVRVYRNSPSYPHLTDDEYLIVSAAEIYAPTGTTYYFQTEVVYEYVNEMRANYLEMSPNPPTVSAGPGGALRFGGDHLKFSQQGGNPGTSSHSSIPDPNLNIYSNNSTGDREHHFEKYNRVIFIDGDIRIIGSPNQGIDSTVMIVSTRDIYIECDIEPVPGSGAQIVIQAMGRILLGAHPPNPRPIQKINADLYAMGTIGPNTNLNSPAQTSVVTNNGGRVFPNQAKLFTWDPVEYPEGPTVADSWEYIERNVSVLKSWHEAPMERN